MIIRVVLIYSIFSALWIFLSDRILAAIVTNPYLLSEIQTFKGWLFVAASAALIALILKRERTGRKLVEAQLRESRRSFQELFSRNPTPMWVFDSKTLAFLAVNQAAVTLYGYSAAEFLQMNLKDIRPPEEVPALLKELKEGRPALQDSGTWRHRKKDGTILFAHVITSAIYFGGREATLVHSEDITERHEIELAYREADRQRIKAEDNLRLEEARLDALLKLNQLVEKSVDEVIGYGLEEGLRFSQSTQGFLAVANLNGSGSAPQSIHSLKLEMRDGSARMVPIPVTGDMTGLIAEVMQERKPIVHNEISYDEAAGDNGYPEGIKRRSLSIPLLDGERVALVAGLSGKPHPYDENDIRHLTLLLDGVSKIALRKQMLEALSHSETRFRSAIESLPFDFWMMDRDGRYIEQNATCIENWGNWIGKRNEDVSIPTDLASLWEENDRRAYQGEYTRMEMSLPARDGELRQVYTVVGPIQSQGNNEGILGINIDITALKQREAELKMINRLSAGLRDLTTRGEVQNLVLDQTMQYLQAECASIFSLDRPSNEFSISIGRGRWSSIAGKRLPVSDFPVLEAIIQSRGTFIQNEIQPPEDQGLPLPLDGCTSIVAVPLIANQVTIGLLFLAKHKPVPDSEVRLLESVAD